MLRYSPAAAKTAKIAATERPATTLVTSLLLSTSRDPPFYFDSTRNEWWRKGSRVVRIALGAGAC